MDSNELLSQITMEERLAILALSIEALTICTKGLTIIMVYITEIFNNSKNRDKRKGIDFTPAIFYRASAIH